MIEAVRLAEEVGIPPGVINVVTGDRETGEALVDHPDVAKIAFTGGVEAGRAIAAARRAAPRRASRWSSAARAPTSSSPTPT